MDYNFKLLTNAKLQQANKTPNIKKRFGMLALSTNKINKNSEIKETNKELTQKQIELEKNLSNNSLITDDDSDTDDDLLKLNKKKNAKSSVFIDINKNNESIIRNHCDVNPFIDESKSFSDVLQVSDSELSGTSPLNIDPEIFRIPPKENLCIEMKKLEILPKKVYDGSEPMFSSNSDRYNDIFSPKINKKNEGFENVLDRMSTQMESLGLTQLNPKLTENKDDMKKKRYTILTISSTESEEILNSTDENNSVFDKTNKTDETPIIISDSDNSDSEDHYQVSTLNSSNKSLSKTVLAKIDDFFNNIPSPKTAIKNLNIIPTNKNSLNHNNIGKYISLPTTVDNTISSELIAKLNSDNLSTSKKVIQQEINNHNKSLPTTVENTMESNNISDYSPVKLDAPQKFIQQSNNDNRNKSLPTTVENSFESNNIRDFNPVNLSTTTDDDEQNEKIIKQTNINVKENKISTPIQSQIKTQTKSTESEEIQLKSKKSSRKNNLIESINISAKIEINIQISHQSYLSTSSEKDSSSSDDSTVPSNSSIENGNIKKSVTSSVTDENKRTSVTNSIKSAEGEKEISKSIEEKEEQKTKSKLSEVQENNSDELLKSTDEKEKEIPEENLPKSETKNDLNTSDFEINDNMKEILNSVYGNEWQTPDILKKCSTKKKIFPKKKLELNQNETQDPNFSLFHQNIRSDLESTRINMKQTNKIPSSTKNGAKKEEPIVKKLIKDNKPTNRMLNFNEKNHLKESEKDNNSDSNFSSFSDSDIQSNRSDSSFKITSSDESESEELLKSRGRKKKITPKQTATKLSGKKLRNSNKKNGEKKYLFGMDTVEIICSDDDNSVDSAENQNPYFADDSITKKTKKLLDSCEFKKKPTIPATPDNFKIPKAPATDSIKTKRKLFTPNYDDIEIPNEIQPQRKIIQTNEPEKLLCLTEGLPTFLLHKQLLWAKNVDTIKSITKPPSPTIDEKKLTKSSDKKEILEKKEVKTDKKNKLKDKPPILKLNADDDDCRTYGFLKSLDEMVSKNICHKDALYYRENYKSKKIELAERLFQLYNEKIFNNKVIAPIVWNKKLLNTAGRCLNSKRVSGLTCKIELSDKVLTSPDRLRCTLLHEMCHAATWLFHEQNGHGQKWREWADKAIKIFPELPKIGVCHSYDIEHKYTYQCVQCNARSFAHSRSKKVEKIRCSYCHGGIKIFINKKNKDGEIIQTPAKEASGFAKFVKDNYKDMKNPKLTHAEVMKLLSAEFAKNKIK